MSDTNSTVQARLIARIQVFLDEGWSFPLSVRKAGLCDKSDQYKELLLHPNFIELRNKYKTKPKRGF